MNRYAIAKHIEEQMTRNEMTRQQLSEALNVSRMTIYNWINHSKMPSAYAVYRMAKVFGVTMEQLMEGVEEE